MQRILIGLLVLTAVGCSGPHKGDVYSLTGGGRIYVDEAAFREAVEREDADAPRPDESLAESLDTSRYLSLDNGAGVKVVEAVHGGARVIAMTGRYAGRSGWMLDEDLKDASKH